MMPAPRRIGQRPRKPTKFQGEMLDEIDAIERELGLTSAISTSHSSGQG